MFLKNPTKKIIESFVIASIMEKITRIDFEINKEFQSIGHSRNIFIWK